MSEECTNCKNDIIKEMRNMLDLSLLSLTQASDLTKGAFSPKQLRHRCQKNKMKYVQNGTKILVRRTEIEKLVNGEI